MSTLREAINESIGQAELARRLGVSKAAVSQWLSGVVPIERCVAIERATNGAVTRRQLRPDDWQEIWPELDRRLEPRAD